MDTVMKRALQWVGAIGVAALVAWLMTEGAKNLFPEFANGVWWEHLIRGLILGCILIVFSHVSVWAMLPTNHRATGWRCHWCGSESMSYTIEPLFDWADATEENMIILCDPCHKVNLARKAAMREERC